MIRIKIYLCLALSSFINLESVYAQMIDEATPANALPLLLNATVDNWLLDFSDEFNESTVNSLKWNVLESSKSRAPRPDLGIDDWWWTEDNVWQENGDLVLRVTKEDHNTMHCGSVNSNDLYETKYGFFEARIKIADASKGTHTAFWFQGDNMDNVDGTANDGAEIDVFESAWLDDYTKSVIHIDGYGANHQANTKKYTIPGIHNGNYHTWGFHWTEDFMDTYYDGEFKVRYDDPKWVVQSPEFLWLSDGASFGIKGDYFTSEPVGTLTYAFVDYVRVWKSEFYDSSTELECENLNSSSPSETDIQIINNAGASGQKHVKLSSTSVGNAIIFDVPIEKSGHHKLTIQGLTWSSFGKYSCAIKTSNGDWQSLGLNIDFYYTNSSQITQDSDEIQLDAGSYQLKLTCEGKDNASSGYVGSFDKITINSRTNIVATVAKNKNANKLSIYPNPTNKMLKISGLEKPTQISIYNISGIQVMQAITQNQVKVDQLSEGLYLIRIKDEVFKLRKY